MKKTDNKEKFGTILDKDVVKTIKQLSADEGRTISDIIQDAVILYKESNPLNYELRVSSVNRFCSRPFHISDSELHDVLMENRLL